jgi:hypothetical protein
VRFILFPRDWRVEFGFGCIIVSVTATFYRTRPTREWFKLLRYWPAKKTA